jgi:secernin
MCDTIVVVGKPELGEPVLFAKNSDREPNEAHEVVVVKHAAHPHGSTVRCTYLEIPQVEETFAVLLSKPAWIWGAEMGANEYGVTIGNEAVFTRVPYEKGPALTGMDLLRLALERADTARKALDVITALLEAHGQGGSCGFSSPFYYHNSFLIADPHEAWVLETAGNHWAAQRVEGTRSISNAITIGNEWDLASPGLVDYAVQRGWCQSRSDFHFARCYSDPLVTFVSDARTRQCRTSDLVSEHSQQHTLTVHDLMQVLRDHGTQATSKLKLREGLMGCDVCMHAGFGPIRINQSTGSMVSQLRPGAQTHWVTATSAPCMSIFKPVWIDSGLPDLGPAPEQQFDGKSLWWRHEILHRSVIVDYSARLPLFSSERDALEADFVARAERMEKSTPQERLSLTRACFQESALAASRWIARVQKEPIREKTNILFRTAWNNFNKQANFPENTLTAAPEQEFLDKSLFEEPQDIPYVHALPLRSDSDQEKER